VKDVKLRAYLFELFVVAVVVISTIFYNVIKLGGIGGIAALFNK